MGFGFFLIVLILFGAIWVMFVMPARRRREEHRAMQDSVADGDEIITAGGIHGIVKTADDELVEVEIAPGVVVKVDRRAVAAVATEIEVTVDAEPEPDLEPDSPAEPR
jgi:preprotein translocase subunit YajC